MQPLVRSVILITAISSLVKLVVNVTEAFAQPSAVLPCPRVTIHMVVVKVVNRLVSQVRSLHGVSQPWAIRPAATRSPTSTSSVVAVRRAAKSKRGTSDMSRSLKKGPFIEPRLLKRIDAMNQKNAEKVIRTWSRASVIFPPTVGHTIAVHDGRRHVPIYVSENMVGH